MALKTSLTGSYPPTFNPHFGSRALAPEAQEAAIRSSIDRAIRDQMELGVDVLVDGQARDDMILVYTFRLKGYAPGSIPGWITGKIRAPDEPVTVTDYAYARSLAGGRPIKAHLTGPVTLARASQIDAASGYSGRNDPRLMHDLAAALTGEVQELVKAGAEIIQIDEPALTDGVDPDLAFACLNEIIEKGRIPFPALHACGNVTRILPDILEKTRFRMVSIEGSWLNAEPLRKIDRKYLVDRQVKIGLGCIQVTSTQIDRRSTVENFLDEMLLRLGEDGIWAAMSNCGMRMLPHEVAMEKIKVMIQAAHSLKPSVIAAQEGLK